MTKPCKNRSPSQGRVTLGCLQPRVGLGHTEVNDCRYSSSDDDSQFCHRQLSHDYLLGLGATV